MCIAVPFSSLVEALLPLRQQLQGMAPRQPFLTPAIARAHSTSIQEGGRHRTGVAAASGLGTCAFFVLASSSPSKPSFVMSSASPSSSTSGNACCQFSANHALHFLKSGPHSQYSNGALHTAARSERREVGGGREEGGGDAGPHAWAVLHFDVSRLRAARDQHVGVLLHGGLAPPSFFVRIK